MNIIAFFQIIYIFIIPISLVYFKKIKYKHRFYAMLLITLGALWIMFIEKWSFKDMGLRFDNFYTSLLPYLLFTLVGVLFIVTLAALHNRNPRLSKSKHMHLYFLFIPISFIQEFLFRSFLTFKLEQVFVSYFWVIIFNALIFTYLHSIYSNNDLALFIVGVGGIGFVLMYEIFPNLILISLAHAVLNFTAVLYGYFFQERKKLSFGHLYPKKIV